MAVPPFLALPQGVTPATIRARDISFATLTAGPESSTNRALLVPGFTGSKEDFIALVPLLGAAEVHVYAMDQAGQYESSCEAGESRFSVTELAADVVAVSEAIWPTGPRPHLVGHSMGGLVSRSAVLRAPTAFASLTMLSSGPSAVPEHKQPLLEALRHALPDATLVDLWVAQQLADEASGVPSPPEDILEFLRTRWLRNSPYSLRAKAGLLLTEPDRTDELAATGIASLVAYGDNDDVWWPAIQKDMAQRLGSQRREISGAAHSPPTETPEQTAAVLLDFWKTSR